MNKETQQSKKRSYSSRLREEQAEQTRERILSAVAALLRSGDLDDLSFGAVAKAAGVSVPTVYRYFPSRDALFDGIQDWISRELKAPAIPSHWSELADGAAPIIAYYEQAHDLFRTAMVTSLFREVGHARRVERDRRIGGLLAPLTDHLDERRANAIHGLIRLMYGFEGFAFLRDRFGTTPEEAGDAIAWLTRALIAQLQTERDELAPAKRAGTVKTKKGSKETDRRDDDSSRPSKGSRRSR